MHSVGEKGQREEEYIQRSLVNLGVSQMLLQSLFAGKGSITSPGVVRWAASHSFRPHPRRLSPPQANTSGRASCE